MDENMNFKINKFYHTADIQHPAFTGQFDRMPHVVDSHSASANIS